MTLPSDAASAPPAPRAASGGRSYAAVAVVGVVALVLALAATYVLGLVVVPRVAPVELGTVILVIAALDVVAALAVGVLAWRVLRALGVPRPGATALGGALLLPGAAFWMSNGWPVLLVAPVLAGLGWCAVAAVVRRLASPGAAAVLGAVLGLVLAVVLVAGSVVALRGAPLVRSCSGFEVDGGPATTTCT